MPVSMNKLYNIKTIYLWPILIALFVLIFWIGPKASPDPSLLKCGKYSRPLMALEQEPTRKEELFESWGDDTKNQLHDALRWDFLFLCIYPLSSGLACFIAGRFLQKAQILSFRVSFVIILLQLAAALFDAIENSIMWRVIDGLTSNFWLTIARISTVGKFGLLGLGMLHAIFGLLVWICLKWLRPKSAPASTT